MRSARIVSGIGRTIVEAGEKKNAILGYEWYKMVLQEGIDTGGRLGAGRQIVLKSLP